MEICGLKEAIEKLKNLQDWYKKGNMSTTIESSELEALCVVLQSLEELQKESDEYKETYSDYQELGKEYAKLQDENEKLREIDFTTLYMMGVSDGKTKLENKIKEKIKELEVQQSVKWCWEQDEEIKQIEILQELLKGE